MIEGLNPGRFAISRAMLDDVEVLLAIMGRCVVVRAEFLYANNCIEYQAFSADFQDIPDGCVMPRYEWQVTDEHDRDTGERIGFELKAVRAET